MRRPETLWFDPEPSVGTRLARFALRPLSWLWHAVAVRRIERGRRAGGATVPAPVIAVGNVVVGGGGKTPATLWVCRALLAMGRRPAVVTRGYGGQGDVPVLRGDAPGPTREAWLGRVSDEALLLATRLVHVPVWIDADRVRGARAAIADGADVIVLDDALQHTRIARDVNIVCFKGPHPVGNGLLMPAGPLREWPVRPASAPPHLWMHTRVHASATVPPAPRGDVWDVVAHLEPRAAQRLSGQVSGLGAVTLRGQRVVLVAGVADPRSVERTVRAMGAEVVETIAPGDHAMLERAVLDRIAAAAAAHGARVVLTEKDAMRLSLVDRKALPEDACVLPVDLVMDQGEAGLLDAVRAALARGDARLV